MKIPIFILIFLFLSGSWGSEFSHKILPPNMQILVFAKSTSDEVKKSLGEPKLVEKKGKNLSYFYNLAGVDYDTTIGFKNGKISSIYFSGFSTNLTFLDFKDLFSEADVKKSLRKMSQIEGHERGRYFEITSVKEGIRLRFSNNDTRTLLSATVWAPGQVQP